MRPLWLIVPAAAVAGFLLGVASREEAPGRLAAPRRMSTPPAAKVVVVEAPAVPEAVEKFDLRGRLARLEGEGVGLLEEELEARLLEDPAFAA